VEGFKTYLLRTVGLANTSINNNVKYLKAFLNAPFEKGLHDLAHFKRFRKLEAVAPEVVYLTVAEKLRLFQVPLAHLPALEQTRDVFLFECETGLRFSDVQALRPEQVSEGYLLLITQKTADLLRVPLSPLAQGILARYAGRCEGRALPVKSNQKTNADLKILGRLARLDTPTTTTQHKGSERVQTTRPKYDLISTHTARRTFVTLALEGGMRPETVMRIIGFANNGILPDQGLIAIAIDDAYHLGILSSKIHEVWVLKAGGDLGGNTPRYNNSICFDPFPFPDATPTQQTRIRELAETLDAHRKRQRAEHPSLTLT
jgi:site-specific recombinase XerD